MNLLSNICNPKDQHFEQQSKTQAYKPLSEYIFENRTMDKMRAKHQKEKSYQQFQYQSWNHPYSISNYLMQQNSQHRNYNLQQQQSGYRGNQNSGYLGSEANLRNGENTAKKISFKDVNQQFCTASKEQQHGERQFRDRDQFYATIKQAHPYYNSQTLIHQDQPQQQHSSLLPQDAQTLNITGQSYSHSLLGKEIIHLKQQNKQLKRVIQNEYKPLKELYNKLLAEQQQRQYLISKLEWKVRELVKDMGASNNNNNSVNANSGGGVVYHHNHQQQTAQVNKSTIQIPINRVQSQQHIYTVQRNINPQQVSSSLLNNNKTPSYQANLIDRNSSQIAFQQQQSHNITNISMYFPQQQSNNNNYQKQQKRKYSVHEQQVNQKYGPSKLSYFVDKSYQSKYVPLQQSHTQTVNFQNSQFIVPNPQTNYYQNVNQSSNFQVKKNS